MLLELRVAHLGVIDDLSLVIGPGMTALTGETGAGKTLLVDAIELLAGGPADASLVRPGEEEALVEGRFALDGEAPTGDSNGPTELVLTRIVPARGRSRCYVDGRMVPLARLAELGRTLVDLHGQHAHQSLLSPAAQRSALDRAAGIDDAEVVSARRAVAQLLETRAALGGDPRSRARELDLLTYQLTEIDAAAIADPDEDENLQAEEELLSDAAGLVEAAGRAWAGLAGDGGVVDRLGALIGSTATRRALAEMHRRLVAAQEDLADLATDARAFAESVGDDPDRLARIGERRRTLTELRRKYGGSLAEVLAYAEELRIQVEELQSHDARSAAVEADLEQATKELAAATGRLWEARLASAPALSRAVEEQLRGLAMPRSHFSVDVDAKAETVRWLLGANPGEPMLPLAKVASGGELSRTMLAARLVMRPPAASPAAPSGPNANPAASAGDPTPSTLVFDEVDAGIGGEAAIAVGQALAALAPAHQVLVVTHLAQVAAFADRQLTVTKELARVDATGPDAPDAPEERTVARVRSVEGPDRVVELARMLSGRPDSESARRHAEELLEAGHAGRHHPKELSAQVSTTRGLRRR